MLRLAYWMWLSVSLGMCMVPGTDVFGLQATGPEIKVETIVDGLFNPAAVAIQPDTGHVFVADSGNLRVIRIVDGAIQEVITGFSKGSFGDGDEFAIGPLGMVFLDAQTLVVGGGGNEAGEDMLMVFKVPEPGAEAVNAEKDRVFGAKLAVDGETVGEGDFFGLAATSNAVFATCNGDDAKGWIARAGRSGADISDFNRSIASAESTKSKSPMGITVSPGGYLAVAMTGSSDTAGDSLLAFFSDKGELKTTYKTGLNDITALAYSPLRQRLFALDCSWKQPDAGGLYKLVRIPEKNDECEPRKVGGIPLIRPTAFAFDPAGNLYIAQCGQPPTEGMPNNGSLIRISGLDIVPLESAEGNGNN